MLVAKFNLPFLLRFSALEHFSEAQGAKDPHRVRQNTTWDPSEGYGSQDVDRMNGVFTSEHYI